MNPYYTIETVRDVHTKRTIGPKPPQFIALPGWKDPTTQFGTKSIVSRKSSRQNDGKQNGKGKHKSCVYIITLLYSLLRHRITKISYPSGIRNLAWFLYRERKAKDEDTVVF